MVKKKLDRDLRKLPFIKATFSFILFFCPDSLTYTAIKKCFLSRLDHYSWFFNFPIPENRVFWINLGTKFFIA
ncbi:hypothetical protein DDT91_08580 [Algoriphagus sp. AK58]|nr:hypothetical protein [Algoriphagus sp. AK58]